MTAAYNNCTGTPGAAPATTDTYPDGSTGYSALNIGSGSTAVYDTFPDGSGMRAIKVSTGASSVSDHFDWNTTKFAGVTQCYFRDYVYFSAAIPGTFRTADQNTLWQKTFTSARVPILQLNSVTKITSSLTCALSTRYRFEWFIDDASASACRCQLKVFVGDSTTPAYDSGLLTGQAGAAGPQTVTRWAHMSALANLPDTYVGGFAADTAGWIGPRYFPETLSAAISLVATATDSLKFTGRSPQAAITLTASCDAGLTEPAHPASAAAAISLVATATDSLRFAQSMSAAITLTGDATGYLNGAPASAAAEIELSGDLLTRLELASSAAAAITLIATADSRFAQRALAAAMITLTAAALDSFVAGARKLAVGDVHFTKAYFGGWPVEKIYYGSTLVWSRA